MKWAILKVFKTIWVVCGILFVFWQILSMRAQNIEPTVFESSSSVTVERQGDYLFFTPTDTFDTVILFYPGALVYADAYAPLCRNLAENGFQTIICEMPWRLATQGYLNIKNTRILKDKSKQYVLMGHSQGAKMAAQFVCENPNLIDQLVLLGTTHPRDFDMSTFDIPILKVYGSNDGVAPVDKIEANKNKLPENTTYVLINGANHAKFGYYGSQLGDNSASISREEQHRQVLDAVTKFIIENTK